MFRCFGTSYLDLCLLMRPRFSVWILVSLLLSLTVCIVGYKQLKNDQTER